MELLDALMPRTRQAILAATLLQPERSWYLRELAEFLGLTPSSLQRELVGLTEAGILSRREDGNRTYFQADQSCPIHEDLRRLLLKTAGLVDLLKNLLRQFGDRIATAFVYGSVAAGEAGSQSDIDLLLVGEIGLSDLAAPLKEGERQLGRQINPVILSSAEATRKLKDRNHFLNTVRKSKKLFLIGEDHELGKAFKR